jgi:putative spermidine/putrescine transport system substrate-binding protein
MSPTLSRRSFIAASGAAAVTGFPNVLRAQTREIFIGGPASPGLTDVLFPLIEKKHNFKILFEGTNSLINLEKIRNNKDRPTMTVTMMDDPVLVLALREKLIEKLPTDVTNLAQLSAEAKPNEAMWANWCQPMCSASHNTKSLPEGVASYADFWDKKYRDGLILISMRITQAVAPLLAATQAATGKPLAECLKLADEGFVKLKELRPNILQVSTNAPQAQQLLETGECLAYLAPDSRTTLFRKAAGASIDQSYPKEGVIAMPAGVALVANGPNKDLGMTFINELLSAETQATVAKAFYSKPTNTTTKLPDGISFPEMVVLDWEYFADNRNRWIERFEREVAAR